MDLLQGCLIPVLNMSKLSDEALKLLEKIDYTNRHQILSNSFDSKEASLEKWDKEIVIKIFKKLGYENVKYKTKEKIFELEEYSDEDIEYHIDINLKYGLVEFICGVKNNLKDIYIPLLPSLTLRYLNIEELPKKPKFTSYVELENLLKEGLAIYEDAKKEIVDL